MNNNSPTNEERERYRELLEELRTIIPGVQVLLAFLLTVPFAARFHLIDLLGKVVFTVSLMAIAASTILFLAPAAYHRLAGRHDRTGRLRYGILTTLYGLSFLALSTCCALFVVIRFLFNSTAVGIVFSGTGAILVFLLWYLHPIRNRNRSGESSESQL
ncbi:DUF6328 family protein [Chitinispirillales bacterium ANBcel5]|uniref:DUF6328 family protein n=1 Tax=Cellulosispirillum alkaliphilum TaxID=3039283 RepID=UPI002A56BA9B|nr:DUF6328 family protein [Chitinispirillales bacterium ANBcel5]